MGASAVTSRPSPLYDGDMTTPTGVQIHLDAGGTYTAEESAEAVIDYLRENGFIGR